jgi:hypothetical protein
VVEEGIYSTTSALQNDKDSAVTTLFCTIRGRPLDGSIVASADEETMDVYSLWKTLTDVRETMNSTIVMLWVGVVFLILAGLLATYKFQLYIRGRYRAEWLTEGAMKGLMALIRWCWAIIWAVCAILFFVGALWLARYALSQWK